MTLNDLSKKLMKFTVDNSPGILTGFGVYGTVATAYLASRASFRASGILHEEEGWQDMQELGQELTNKQKFSLIWKEYIPATFMGGLTIASIIGANHIGTRRAAALAAAYSISEKAFEEYKEKVVEKIGENKERQVRDEVAQDNVTKRPVSEREVIVAAGGDVLCYDSFTGRYFKSDMETLKKAQNDLNYRVLNDYYASLSDFYNLIGLATTSYSDEVGWNSNKLMELDFSTVLSDDGRPCIAISFLVAPIRDYYRLQ